MSKRHSKFKTTTAQPAATTTAQTAAATQLERTIQDGHGDLDLNLSGEAAAAVAPGANDSPAAVVPAAAIVPSVAPHSFRIPTNTKYLTRPNYLPYFKSQPTLPAVPGGLKENVGFIVAHTRHDEPVCLKNWEKLRDDTGG